MNRVLKKEKTENKTSVRYFEGLNLWIFAAVFVANVFFQLSEVSSSLFLYVPATLPPLHRLWVRQII